MQSCNCTTFHLSQWFSGINHPLLKKSTNHKINKNLRLATHWSKWSEQPVSPWTHMMKHRNMVCIRSSKNPKCFRSLLVRFTAERVSCQEKCCCVAGHWLKQMSVWATTRFISEMYSVPNGLGHMTAIPRWEIDELWIFHAQAVSALFKVRPGAA